MPALTANIGAVARLTLLIIAATRTFAVAPVRSAPSPTNEIFAMDNGVGRGTWSPARQASTLREMGFDGISYNYTNPADLQAWLAELAPRKLKLYGIYFGVRLDGAKPLPAGIEDAVALLRGTGAVLWITIPQPAHPGDNDAQAVKRVQEVADLAARAGLRVVLYPHFKLFLATAEQAFDLASRSGRANVGITVNLSHELAAGNGSRLPEIIRRVAPLLSLVTINGASDLPGPDWNNYIQRLGAGDYNVAGVLKTLRQADYLGPVGIQFYSLKGDPRDNLEATMRAWRALISHATAP